MDLSDAELLHLWEAGSARHAIDRDLLLLSLAMPALAPERLADVPLGRRNVAIMDLRQAYCGERLDGWVDCTGCGERMEFSLSAAQLPTTAPPQGEVQVAGLGFRAPSSRDLVKALAHSDPGEAAHALLQACAHTPQALPEDRAALGELLLAVEQAIEAHDPWTELSIAMTCPACGEANDFTLDAGDLLWEALCARVEHLLDDVHDLARAYGWSQAEVLALSPAARQGYLRRVRA